MSSLTLFIRDHGARIMRCGSRQSAFDVLRWLRNDQGYQRVPVFVVGSEIIDRDVNEAYALGANSCLLKKSTADGFDPTAQSIATYASLAPAV